MIIGLDTKVIIVKIIMAKSFIVREIIVNQDDITILVC